MTALGGGISTIGAGFVGAWLHKKVIDIKGLTLRNAGFVVFITALWETTHMAAINPLPA